MMDLITRFRPFVVVGLWLLFWAVAVNLALAGLGKTSAFDWLPDRSSGIGFILESRQRVEAAERAYQSSAISRGQPLVAVVGISDVREGVRLDALSKATCGRWRFIGVAGAGAGIGSIEDQAALVLESKLPVDVVVLGLSPLVFIDGTDLEQGAASAETQRSLVDVAKAEIKSVAWLPSRRSDLNIWLDGTLDEGRSGLLKSFGVQAGEDNRSPWRPLLRTLGVEHYPDAHLRKSVATLKATGADRLETFETPRAEAAAGELVRQIQARGAQVIVVQLPRHPWLNELLPPTVSTFFADQLRRASGDRGLTVLDFSDRVDADGFIDLVHLNTSGGEELSMMLGNALLRSARSVSSEDAGRQ